MGLLKRLENKLELQSFVYPDPQDLTLVPYA